MERLMLGVVLVALVPLMGLLPAIVSLGLLALMLAALIGWETYRFAEEREGARHANGHQQPQ